MFPKCLKISSLLIKKGEYSKCKVKVPKPQSPGRFPTPTGFSVIGWYIGLSLLPSELEDDLLGEDLLSGKKVRKTGLSETKW